jgi:arsenite oxidase small subunit
MMKMSRRRFLQASATTALLASTGGAHALVAPSLPYPRKRVANIRDLKEDQPILFSYPDDASPAILVKLGREAFGGIGPQRDIVAFSSLCTHQGCPVSYEKKRFICKCHYSMFDPAKNGQTYQGHASEWLPQIILRYEPRTGDIYAEGVEGLIWGRASNLIAKK